MSQPIKINTGKYIQHGKIEIDGHVWTVKMPGAGTELRYSQAQRGSKLYGSRIQLLDKKIDNGTITEEELDKYEEYSAKFEENERIIYDVFKNVFQDGTKDNSEVNKWLEETSLSLIILAFDEISQNADNLNSKIKESDDGEKETAKEDKESS
jgi:hypothetical protein